MTFLVAGVVSHNRLEQLKTSVAALLPQRCDAVVVVDNCSTDGTREWLDAESQRHDRLDVVLAPRNLGGAGGFELGLRHALVQYEPDWLVCFDDDAYPDFGAFDAFLASDLDGVDAAAAAVYFPDGRICEMNRPTLNPFWHWRLFVKTVLGHGRRGFKVPDAHYSSRQPVAIDSSSFLGFFVRRQMVERVGLPDGRLFVYGDDVIYTLKITRAGGRIRFLPCVRFTHDCSAVSIHENTIKPLWKTYYICRNTLRMYHVSAGLLFWPFLPVKLAKWLFNARFYTNPRPYLKLVWAGLTDFVARRYDRTHEEVVRLADGGAD